jgi:hypothetical protein
MARKFASKSRKWTTDSGSRISSKQRLIASVSHVWPCLRLSCCARGGTAVRDHSVYGCSRSLEGRLTVARDVGNFLSRRALGRAIAAASVRVGFGFPRGNCGCSRHCPFSDGMLDVVWRLQTALVILSGIRRCPGLERAPAHGRDARPGHAGRGEYRDRPRRWGALSLRDVIFSAYCRKLPPVGVLR